MPRQYAEYKDFTGGWVHDVNPQDNELELADNVEIDPRGYIQCRKGLTAATVAALSPAKELIEFPRDDGTTKLYALLENGELCLRVLDGGLSKVTDMATLAVGHFVFKNKLYLTDGSSYRKYDAENVRNVILDTPTAPTCIATAMLPKPDTPTSLETADTLGGAAIGNYWFLYTVVNSLGIESPGSDYVTGCINVLKNAIKWTISTGPVGTTKYRLYRSKVESPGTYYLLAELDSPGDFVDRRSDSELFAQTYVAPNSGLNGASYACRCTYVDSDGAESALSPDTVVTVASGDGIKWTLPIGPSGTVSRRMYRTAATSSGIRLIREITDNTTTDVIDRLSEADILNRSIPKDNDPDPIKRCRFLIRHSKSYRIFAAGDPNNPSTLYYSEPNEPHLFQPLSKMVPSTGEGPITGLAAFGDAVLVFFTKAIWAWRGSDPTDAQWFALPINQGTVAPRTICLTSNSITFMGQDGIYEVSPAILDYNLTLDPGTEIVRNRTANKLRNILNWDPINREQACAVWDPSNRTYYLAYCDSGSNNNKIIALNWDLNAFTRFLGFYANDMLYGRDGLLYIAGYCKNDGLFIMGGESDNGNPISCTVRTKKYDLGSSISEKRLYKTLLATNLPSTGATVKVDSDDGSYEAPEIPTLTQAWSNELVEFRSKLSGRLFQVTITTQKAQNDFELQGVAFECKHRRPKGIR